jgi:DNA repair protein SbcC/Rad50
MQLRRVRVKNIRSYESGEVAFANGTTLLTGDVGAGKTSLLYAIEMALFGVAEVDAAYLVRHGAGHAEVEVEFEDSDHQYRIARKFRRVRRKGKESFEPERIAFTVDGAQTTYSATELRQRVIELLGFPDNPNPQAHSDLWRWAVYVPQERMRDILGARPQDRLETVRKALGVERYRIAAENAQEVASDLRRSTATRRAEAERLRHFDREFAEGTADADRLSTERRTLEITIGQLGSAVAAAESRFREAEAAARQIEADRRELESLVREQGADDRARDELLRHETSRREALALRHREITEASPEASEVDRRRARLTQAEARRAEARAALDRHASQLRSLAESNAELAAATRRTSDAQTVLDRVKSDLAEAARERDRALSEGPGREPPAPTPRTLAALDAALAEARGAEAESLAALSRSQSSLSELDDLLKEGVCPRCHQPVRAREFEAHRTEATEATRLLESSHAAAVRQRERLEDERRSRERYERAFERWKDAEQRRARANAGLARATEAVETAQAALDVAAASVTDARRRAESLAEVEADEEALKSSLAQSEADLRDRSQELERAVDASARCDAARSAAEAIESELARLARDVAAVVERSAARTTRRGVVEQALVGAAATTRSREEAETAWARQRRSLEETNVVLARTEARWEDAVRRVRAAERGRAERAELTAEADDLERKATWVGGPFRNSLLTMEHKLLGHAQAVFERYFARYFASLVDDPSLVARTDVAFTPAVTLDGEWTPAEALSGGERTSLALAFRLALAQVVRSLGSLRLDTILLDEPTDGFSPEQVVRMGELLDELALPQVVLVSHEGELASIADRVVRVEKRDGRSTLRRPAEGDTPAPALPAEAESPGPVRERTSRARRPALP